jgi:osmotically-inducible protein OsmY
MKTQSKKLVLTVIFLVIFGGGFSAAADYSLPDDAAITAYVKEALRDDPAIDSLNIEVDVSDGIVTLNGTVPTLAARNYADKEVKKIAGVRGVINEITIPASNRPSGDISQDIQARIMFDPSIESNDITVSVNDGDVTLQGTVGSFDEKQEAGFLANGVRGVRAVDNHLAVKYTSTRPDNEILMDVQNAIQREVYLSGLPIAVAINNGVITLAGEVGDLYQKERASDKAWGVSNVTDVINNIEVRPSLNQGVRKNYPVPTDEQLQHSVNQELFQDLRLNPFNIQVSSEYGNVILRGTVPLYLDKRLAEQDAKNVVGVMSVRNLLQVTAEPRNNSELSRDIMTVIDSDSEVSGQDIKVKANNGVVTLSGNVNQLYEKYEAERVAGNVRGVFDVINNIVINKSPRYTDEELQKRIEDRFKSHADTAPVAGKIHVSVLSGDAILTGDVNLWSQRREAGNIALKTDGIWDIQNNIKVAGSTYPSQGSGYSYYWPYEY